MKKEWLLPLVFVCCMAVFLAADIAVPDRIFSAQENRRLAQKPAFSVNAMLDKSFMEQYEAYVTDQFPGRDGFIALKTFAQRLLGKKDVNGVYFAPGNTLVERHGTETVDMEKANRKSARMVEQALAIQDMIAGRVGVMLVPSADSVQAWRLPAFAESFDQEGWIDSVGSLAREAGITAVDAYGALAAHEKEDIFYGTDHHWTTLGAFYGYQAWAKAWGLPAAELTEYERTVVREDFLGTLQAKVNLSVTPDRIERFDRTGEGEHRLRLVYEKQEAASCYFYEKLQTKDAYTFFLGGNYPVAEIEGDRDAGRSIMLIKDSFANCFAPFLTRDYARIWLVDRRYYRGDVTELIREYQPEDVLYLYNVFQFVEESG